MQGGTALSGENIEPTHFKSLTDRPTTSILPKLPILSFSREFFVNIF